jgi:PIN domain nuclease of toxin-antitoxin system
MGSKKLSREQSRVLRDSVRQQETLGISAMTLMEIAALFGSGVARSEIRASELLRDLESNPAIEVIPFAFDAAAEMAALGPSLRDPSDRAMVATARVLGLRLITSDQRIIDSNLVPVVV